MKVSSIGDCNETIGEDCTIDTSRMKNLQFDTVRYFPCMADLSTVPTAMLSNVLKLRIIHNCPGIYGSSLYFGRLRVMKSRRTDLNDICEI